MATFALLLTACTYLRGAWLLRRAGYPCLPAWRIASFILGLFSTWVALASPFDTFNLFVLTAHMLQHMTLMMVAPPLILLGEPLIPIVRGMPRFAAREFAGPLLNWPVAARLALALTHPVVALVLMGLVMFAWHVPALYELALRSGAWHQTEHASFFLASLIFWWPVVQPWPSRPQWPRWAMVPYLVIADLQNTALSAVLVFSDKLLYPSYGAAPRLFGLTAQQDQAAAGAIMWVVGSLAYIVPAVLIAIQCLTRKSLALRISPTSWDESAAAGQRMAGTSSRPPQQRWLGWTFPSRSLETTSFLVLFVIVIASFLVLASLPDDDDDQVLRLSQAAGPFAIAIFGPEDVPTGPASFSVLVQDRGTNDVLLDSNVAISPRKLAADTASQQRIETELSDGNRLLRSAEVNLNEPGDWFLDVAVQHSSGSATISLPVQVVAHETAPAIRWPYVVAGVVVGLLGFVYLWRHKARASAGLATPLT